jgi:hypothetical protein
MNHRHAIKTTISAIVLGALVGSAPAQARDFRGLLPGLIAGSIAAGAFAAAARQAGPREIYAVAPEPLLGVEDEIEVIVPRRERQIRQDRVRQDLIRDAPGAPGGVACARAPETREPAAGSARGASSGSRPPQARRRAGCGRPARRARELQRFAPGNVAPSRRGARRRLSGRHSEAGGQRNAHCAPRRGGKLSRWDRLPGAPRTGDVQTRSCRSGRRPPLKRFQAAPDKPGRVDTDLPTGGTPALAIRLLRDDSLRGCLRL